MMQVPSTINSSVNDNGIRSAISGLFKTGVEFLGNNLFGGDKEDELASLRRINAQQTELIAQRAQTPPILANQGGGLTPTFLIAGVGFALVLGVFLRVRS